MAGVKAKISREQLRVWAAKGLNAGQIAEVFNVSREAVWQRAKAYGITLQAQRRVIHRSDKVPELKVQTEETPPSRALRALAPYDDIARRALARKTGEVLRNPLEDQDSGEGSEL